MTDFSKAGYYRFGKDSFLVDIGLSESGIEGLAFYHVVYGFQLPYGQGSGGPVPVVHRAAGDKPIHAFSH